MKEEREKSPVPSWSDLLGRAVDIGLGAAALTAETAQRVAGELARRGRAGGEESAGLIDRLAALAREHHEKLAKMVDGTVERATARMDLARNSEVEALRRRVAALELALRGQAPCGDPVPPGVEQGEVREYLEDQY